MYRVLQVRYPFITVPAEQFRLTSDDSNGSLYLLKCRPPAGRDDTPKVRWCVGKRTIKTPKNFQRLSTLRMCHATGVCEKNVFFSSSGFCLRHVHSMVGTTVVPLNPSIVSYNSAPFPPPASSSSHDALSIGRSPFLSLFFSVVEAGGTLYLLPNVHRVSPPFILDVVSLPSLYYLLPFLQMWAHFFWLL